ncbi:M3 family oligoendopeptidase [Isobaculum melis]|uniref:Oligoendopeptidase, pepF/M3 family n=1 Tax=Isobaculum melis TaxID=142588 RepID=A0A1H9SZP5_9LACT|nr:M3 family oligoendopeptidase [Isobaculum melis]SER90297.1 oligoendopeptidase, pepF/M3 family [Isobaculum melis]
MTYSETWDLETIFAGGTTSADLQERMNQLKAELALFEQHVVAWDAQQDKPDYQQFAALLALKETVTFGFRQCLNFVNCCASANVSDKNATKLAGLLASLNSEYLTAWTLLIKKIGGLSESEFNQLLTSEQFEPIAFVLKETREKAQALLNEPEEVLLNALNIDGIHAWGEHYGRIVNLIQFPFKEADGTISYLSAGQAQNKMMDDPDAAVREQMFESWEASWKASAPLFADTLNHLAGSRLTDYKAHGVEDYLEEPLSYNRMSKETLDAMWETITKNKAAFKPFFDRKASLLGKEKLAWQDVAAPVIVGDATPQVYSFDEAAAFIIKQFGKFGDKMAQFAQSAFEKAWIEAEDRPGKRPGGYCTTFPESGESRIFMTFGGSPGNVSTLAHELGHAFHGHVLRELPALNRDYAMNVAETASTFAEMIVADATVKEATSTAEEINLLDNKIENATTMFFNIHARFIFESNFYEERKNGVLSEDQLCDLMEAAQKESYLDMLSSYHPHFWASKLHFYKTNLSFYNFPYTFGYLFSLGIYARSLEEGKGFEEKYIALLQDTAAMTTEELAMKHLGVDLTKPDFWQAGIDLVLEDVARFMAITD